MIAQFREYFTLIDEGDIKLSFIAEWFDPHPQVVDRFLLKYYPKSQEVEMKDLKATRKFLKRTKIKLPRDDFILDAVVVIFSRDLKLVSYGDDETRLLLEASSEKALTILNNCSIGKVLSMSEEAGLTLVDMKTFDTRTMKNTSISFGKVYLEVRGEGAVSLLEGIIESTEKKDTTMVLASTSKEAITIKEEFLLKKHQPPAVKYETGDQGTCCAIKPHAIKSRLVGKIIEDIISRDLNIKSMQVVHMDRTRASEFNEVYCKLKEFHSEYPLTCLYGFILWFKGRLAQCFSVLD